MTKNSSIIFEVLKNDKQFMKPGRRNNDCVDLCIAIYAAGDGDPKYFDENYEHIFSECIANLTPEDAAVADVEYPNEVKRIEPYLTGWYNSGDIWQYLQTPMNEYRVALKHMS